MIPIQLGPPAWLHGGTRTRLMKAPMSDSHKMSSNSKMSWRELRPIIIFLVVALTVTVAAWLFERDRIARVDAILFERASEAIQDDTIEVMRRHVQALRGGSGLYRASENVSGAEWAQYVAGSRLHAKLSRHPRDEL